MTIKEAQEKHTNDLLALPNVVGTAIGQKFQYGKGVGRIAIVVFVRVKVPVSQLSAQDVVPRMLEGYETDVEETGEIILQK